jgi:hypothetical protein
MSVLTAPTISATLLAPFGLSLPFDRLRMIGNTTTSNTTPTPFGLSLPFDRLRMIGNSGAANTLPTPFGLGLSKPCLQLRRHFDKLSANGYFLCFKFWTTHK